MRTTRTPGHARGPLLLKNLNSTKGSLQGIDVKEWLRIHEPDLDMSTLRNDRKKVAVNYLMDSNEVKEVQLMDVPEETYGDSDDATEIRLTAMADLEAPDGNQEEQVTSTEAETKEILMIVVRRRKRTEI